ncbi:MAG: RdgB/HAM1 family non-canonical purine NTP pyrophosphatase [Chitinophagaceae bacterium]
MKLIFATNNLNKIEEIRQIIGESFQLITLKEAGIFTEIPEPHSTLEQNASEKSFAIYKMTNTNCFSEDTGLEVTALHGEPGVKSARYTGDERSFEKNMDKLLDKLKNTQERTAQFKTVISLILGGSEVKFTGICKGKITREKKGFNGFGYDPIFLPDGSDKTFGEMSIEEKGVYSHRTKATMKLVAFLTNSKQIKQIPESKY